MILVRHAYCSSSFIAPPHYILLVNVYWYVPAVRMVDEGFPVPTVFSDLFLTILSLEIDEWMQEIFTWWFLYHPYLRPITPGANFSVVAELK